MAIYVDGLHRDEIVIWQQGMWLSTFVQRIALCQRSSVQGIP